MHARIMLVTSEMKKKSVEIVTERCPRLPRLGIESYIKIAKLFHVFYRISVETDNHFESSAASATDKENDMRHIPRGKYYKSTGFEQGL